MEFHCDSCSSLKNLSDSPTKLWLTETVAWLTQDYLSVGIGSFKCGPQEGSASYDQRSCTALVHGTMSFPAEDVAPILRVMIRPEISKFVLLFSFLNPTNIPPVWLSLHPTALWNQAHKCPILWQSAIRTSCETDFEYVDFELPETGKVRNLNNR